MHESTPGILKLLPAQCQQACRQGQNAAQRSCKDVTKDDVKAFTISFAKIFVLANCLAVKGVIDANRFSQTSQSLSAKPGWFRLKRAQASFMQRGA